MSKAQRQRTNPAVEERRKSVLRAVVAVYAITDDWYGVSGVRPFQVRFFGLPECVTELDLVKIRRDLGWLKAQGYVEAHAGEFEPTDKGRKWIA